MVSERVRTKTLTVLNIHSFHTFILALVLYRVMRLEPFLGHMQDKPLDRLPVHYTHSYSHSLQSPVHLSCVSLDCGRNQHQHRENIQTQHSNTAPHYTRLMRVVVVVVIASCIFLLYFYMYFYVFVFFFFTSKC